jgi:putative membrane protein
MNYALYFLTGWLTTTSALISWEHTQSNERIAKERNSEQFSSDAERDAQLVVDLTSSNYADMLQAEHTTLVNQLKAYAAGKNIMLPAIASNEAIENANKLAENNQPAGFDKKWCTELLNQQEQTISRMESAVKDATDPDLKAWINTTLPKIRMHRHKLKECNASIR